MKRKITTGAAPLSEQGQKNWDRIFGKRKKVVAQKPKKDAVHNVRTEIHGGGPV